MFLLNRRCMIYLLEFQASSLFRPFIVKILGGMTHKCIADSFFFFLGLVSLLLLHEKMLTLSDVPNAVIFVKGLILLPA